MPQSNMKILFVADYYQPQLGYSEYHIPYQLKKKGHTVQILTSNFYYPFPDYEQTSGKILGPREQESGVFNQKGITVIKEKLLFEIFTRAVIGNHQKHLELFKPNLVIVNKSASYNIIRMAQLKKKFGYTLLTYDTHLPSGFYANGNIAFKKAFYWVFRLLFAKLLEKEVDVFIAGQEKTVEIMREFYGQKNAIHIPLGTDTTRFYFDRKAGTAIRKKLSIKPDDFVVLYSGKLIETKGIHILGKATKKLFQKYKNIFLVLVGSGAEKYLEQCFADFTAKEKTKVKIVGFQKNEELYQYYSAADVGVWPLEESTAMNDLAACGIPFIANDTIGAKTRIGNNNALLYKKGNNEDLAKKIEYLYKNPEKRKQMGKNGHELISRHLSWEKIVEEYLRYATSNV